MFVGCRRLHIDENSVNKKLKWYFQSRPEKLAHLNSIFLRSLKIYIVSNYHKMRSKANAYLACAGP